LASLPIKKEIPIDEAKTVLYEETPPEKKKSKKWLLIAGTLALAFLGLIFTVSNREEPPVVQELPPPTVLTKHALNLTVLDTANQAIKDATIIIFSTGQVVKRDSTGVFSLELGAT